jgi:hypothetical protein
MIAPTTRELGMTGGIAKRLGGLALAGALASAGAAQAQAQPEKPPVVARAEQCLRQKVDRVVADEPDIAAAANFLVGYACAEEVAGATRYLRSETYVQLFGSIFKAVVAPNAAKAQNPAPSPPQGAGATAAAAAATASALLSQLVVDPNTGDIRMSGKDARASQMNSVLNQSSAIMSQFMPDNIPVPIRKLAGDLVLEARERQKAK